MWETEWPLVGAVVLWLAVAGWTWWQIRRSTGGNLIYASDDVYIHMAMARNLLRHGVWGVTPYGFTSSASSLIWPVLLAATYALFGVNEWSPLAINMIASLALLVEVDRIARRHGASSPVVLAVLLATIFFVPLTAIVFAGMETVLQVLLSLVFAEALWSEVSQSRQPPLGLSRSESFLVGLAICLTLVRYEGLFLVLAGALLLAWRRRFRLAIMVVAGGLLPVVGWALLSIAKGWYPLPNSVLVKSAPFTDILPEAAAMTLTRALRFLSGKDFMLSLTLGLFLLWAWGWAQGIRGAAFFLPGVFFLLVVVQHGTLIDIEWFYRHGAYLVMLGIWTLETTASGISPMAIRGTSPAVGSAALCGVLLLYPLLARGTGALTDTPAASYNIYEMQYQMGLFLRQNYSGQAVAANDIGAIDYLADLHLVDLYGLASMDVARAKLTGQFTTAVIERVTSAQGARIAIVYDLWFAQVGLPSYWVKVREWHYHDCYVCGEDTVSFYALSADQVAPLRSDLDRFSKQLPRSVQDSVISP
jgi:hypothetical protein